MGFVPTRAASSKFLSFTQEHHLFLICFTTIIHPNGFPSKYQVSHRADTGKCALSLTEGPPKVVTLHLVEAKNRSSFLLNSCHYQVFLVLLWGFFNFPRSRITQMPFRSDHQLLKQQPRKQDILLTGKGSYTAFLYLTILLLNYFWLPFCLRCKPWLPSRVILLSICHMGTDMFTF